NEISDLPKNVGYISAQAISEKGVDIVIAGCFGPNATAVFRDNGVSQVVLPDLTVHDAALKATSINKEECYGTLNENINLRNSDSTAGNRTIMQDNLNRPFVIPFICPKCSCTMPRKPAVTSMKCPNCGSDMN
ncbi:MAG: NifB/NifX family molybdenum-iron cluster-binding protein, partial [Methanogenium sp.]|nr:NifB/NifX family molybdenum-iron cluster-binding protein [Methanogenium sp.]